MELINVIFQAREGVIVDSEVGIVSQVSDVQPGNFKRDVSVLVSFNHVLEVGDVLVFP